LFGASLPRNGTLSNIKVVFVDLAVHVAVGTGAGEENEGALRPAQGGHDAESGPAGGQPLQYVQSGAGQVPVGVPTHVRAHRAPFDGSR